MSSDKKPKSLEDLWDRSRQKLLVYVIEGVSLLTKSGAGNPYVKIFIDKQKFKTQALKHSEDPVWKELFLFEFTEQQLNEGSQLDIEVYNKQSIGADKLIGIAKCAVPTHVSEEVADMWIDLQLPPNMKEKNKELLDGKLGNIHLRLLFSNAKETPVSPPGNNQISSFHLTKDIKAKMKSGDILLYSGIGPLDSCLKTLTNTKYSRVALVFRELNKWTQKEQLFLFEVTRNVGGFPDAFSERCAGGANIFRLEERLHQLSVKSVWWSPLKERLDPESGEPNMIDWLWEVHEGRQQIADFVAPIPSEIITMFASQFEFNVIKQQFAVAELNSTQFLINALRLGGRRLPFSGAKEFVAPIALLGLNYFDDPVLLRQRRSDVDAATLESVLTGSTVANDREAAIAAANAVAAGAVAAAATAAGTPEKGAFAPPSGAGRETHRMTMLSSADPKRSTSAAALVVNPQTLAAAGVAAEKESNAFERKDSGPIVPEPAPAAATTTESAPAPAPAEITPAEKPASTNPFDDEPAKKEEPKSLSTNPFDEPAKKEEPQKEAASKPQPPPKKKKSTKVMSPTITPANASTSTVSPSSVPIPEPLPAEAVAAISPAPTADASPVAQPEPAAPAPAEPAEAKPASPRAEPEKSPEAAAPDAQPEASPAPAAAAAEGSASVTSPPKLPKKPKESKTMRGEAKDKPKKDKSGVQRKATHGTDKPKKVAKKPETSSNRLSVRVSGGIMPLKFEERSYTAKIIFDFDAENEGELSAKKGEVVRVLDDISDPDWALVRKMDLSSDYGCVPKTYLKKVVEQPAQ